MALSFTFNPFTGNFDTVSNVTVSSPGNGLAVDANQVLTLSLATSSTPGSVANVGSAFGVATLDANGLIPISQLPPSAIERLVIVADQAARYALTTATVQNGDTVLQTDINEMFFVKDDTNLNNASGYQVYSAGSAAVAATFPTTQVSNNASYYPLMAASSSNGNQSANLGTGFSFNPSTNTLTTTTFSGALSGNATTATTATNANNIATTAKSDNVNYYLPFVAANSSSNQALDVGPATYNPSTSTLTATTFSGALSGNASTATTATNSTNAAVTSKSDNVNYYLTFVGANSSSNQGLDVGPATYNPSTSTLTATTFAGALTGTASGNATRALDNLSGVAINADLVSAQAGTFTVKSQNATSATSQAVIVQSGDTVTGGVTGAVTVTSGAAAGSSASGNATFSTGNSNAKSGDILIQTGTSGSSSATGAITIYAQQTSGSQSGGRINIKTGSRESDAINIFTTNLNGSGYVNIFTGNGTTTTSGQLALYTGTVTTGTSGSLVLYTGNATGTAGTTGTVSLSSGASNTAASGTVSIFSGDTGAGTGDVSIYSGAAGGGNSGKITIQTGTATGTRGAIYLKAPNTYTTGVLTPWSASTAYVVNQEVIYSQSRYVCQVAHTSNASTMEPDIALGKWAFVGATINSAPNLMLIGGNFEDNDVAGWTGTGCATITNGLPASVGSGGAVFSSSNGGRALGANTTAPAVTSSNPIDGIYSLNLATSGAGTIGDGYISQSIPISPAYRAKALTVKFKYKSASGSPVMAGDATNTYAAAVYDVTNNAWIGMAGCFNFVQSSGVGDFVGTFQTASTTAAVQVFIYSPVAPVGASSLLIDNVYLGQQVSPQAPAVSDWTSYTPTGSWSTNTTYTGYQRRVGDSLECRIKITLAGAPTSATLTVNLPSGLSIDTNKINADAYNVIGKGVVQSAGIASEIFVQYDTTTAVYPVSLATRSGSNPQLIAPALITQSAPGTFANADFIYFEYKVPITGWSSNSAMSNDTDTRVVAFTATGSATALTKDVAASVAWTTTTRNDGGGNFDGTSYTVPVTGWYVVNSSCRMDATYTTTQLNFLDIQRNGSAIKTKLTSPITGTSIDVIESTKEYFFNAGDTIRIQVTCGGVGPAISSQAIYTHFNVNRLSGPAVIAATESVSALYTGKPAESLTGSWAKVTYGTKVKDTHNAYSSGIYTIPVSGTYSIQAITFQEATVNLAQSAGTAIAIDGTVTYKGLNASNAANGSHIYMIPSVNVHSVPLKAGQTVQIQCLNEGSSLGLVSDGTNNYFSIVRTGNY